MPEKQARHIAIDILSRRDNSEKEMREKLKRKGVSQQEIADTIDWLRGKKLLNDVAFAQRKAESIYRTKLVGPSYIRLKLKGAGVADSYIEEAIEALGSDKDWNARAHDAVAQWKKVHPKYANDRIRQMRFLQSRGFDGNSIEM